MNKTMNIYSAKAQARRDQFNKLINGCNMVLMNNIPEVDPSVWDNFEGSLQLCEFNYQNKICTYHNEILDETDARHNQYITYSGMLDTYFLAICHFGTSWDYTSMVDDFEDCYHGLDDLDDQKEVV